MVLNVCCIMQKTDDTVVQKKVSALSVKAAFLRLLQRVKRG